MVVITIKQTNRTCQIHYSEVTVAAWLEDDDKDERQAFFEELEEDLVDIQDPPSTRILYQYSVDKTTLVSQNSLKLET